MKKTAALLSIAIVLILSIWAVSQLKSATTITNSDGHSLVFNLSSERSLHFAWIPKGRPVPKRLEVTDMVARHSSPKRLAKVDDGWESENIKVHVDQQTCASKSLTKSALMSWESFAHKILSRVLQVL